MATADKTILFEVRAPVGNPGTETAPAWVLAMTPRIWAPVAMVNTLQSVQSPASSSQNVEDVLRAYNGAVAVPPGRFADDLKGALLFHGGGHNSYDYNEVYAILVGQRRWARLNDPYPTPSGSTRYPEGVFPDGTPTTGHYYNYVGYDPVNHALFKHRASQVMDSGFASDYVRRGFWFDLAAKAWTKKTINYGADVSGSGGGAIWDSLRQCWWVHAYSGSDTALFQVSNNDDPTDNTRRGAYSASFGTFVAEIDCGHAYDPQNDLFVVADFRSTARIRFRDLKNPSTPAVVLNVASIPGGSAVSMGGALGFQWSQGLLGFVAWNRQSTNVWLLKWNGGPWNLASSWAFTQLTSPSNTVNPMVNVATSLGPYSKFNLFKWADAEIAIVTFQGNQVHAFRIS